MSLRRGFTKDSSLFRDNEQTKAEIAREYLFVGPIRDPAYLHGRICPADWVRCRWMRKQRPRRVRAAARPSRCIVGEWVRVRA